MFSGHLAEVTTRLVCGDERREYYGVASPDAALARELVIATQVITADQTVRVASSLSTAILTSLAMHPDEVRMFGCSESTDVQAGAPAHEPSVPVTA